MKEISLKKDNYIEKATESFKNIISSGILKKKDFIPEDLPLFLQILIDSPAMLKQIKPFIKSNKVDYIQLEEFLLPIVGKDTLLTALSQDYKVPAIDLEEADISPHLGNIIPSDIGKSFFVTCVAIDENGITLAMVNPRDDYAVSQVETKTNFKVVNRFVVLYKDIVDFMDLLYGTPRGLSISPRELVDDIIKRAVTIGASDIHIEPLEDDIKVRFRKDGMLDEEIYNIRDFALKNKKYKKLIIQHLKNSISVVIKNKSGTSGVTMNIAETQKPQDGRIFLPVRNLDMRVSILPTTYGESIVIRLLSSEKEDANFIGLGFSEEDNRRFEKIISLPYGIVLVSGPTGSGKSTTLYTVLRKLYDPTKKIVTVEDPVEYTVPGVMQVQFNQAKDVTFATALRSFLRHDPDIIMVGEIRDSETASMAIEASLTGHLVLSTIHANDAVRTITRIKDLGVNPLLITSTCLATMAQRLLRKNCPHCAMPAHYSQLFYKLMDHFKIKYSKENLVKSVGCKRCNKTGYLGRTGIFELMIMTPEIKELILKEAPDDQLEKLARKQGMRLLLVDALYKVAAGLTTEEEIKRVTLSDFNADHGESKIIEEIVNDVTN